MAGAAVSHDDLVLEAADGNRFAAFEATPDEPNGIGVVILPDVRGLYRFYEELALRFAERGYLAIAIDWFGRTAGVGKRARSSNTRNTRRRRRRREYGMPGDRGDGLPGPIDRAATMEAPILALQAGADQNITAELNDAFERALTDAGVEHQVVTYEGAPHSFFDRRQEDYAEASDDAWRRVLDFLGRHGRD
jgi:carboxymethylenebutenolidase